MAVVMSRRMGIASRSQFVALNASKKPPTATVSGRNAAVMPATAGAAAPKSGMSVPMLDAMKPRAMRSGPRPATKTPIANATACTGVGRSAKNCAASATTGSHSFMALMTSLRSGSRAVPSVIPTSLIALQKIVSCEENVL